MQVSELLSLSPVIPVIVIDDAAHAVPLAEALVAGGLPVLEVTLRTPAALDAVKQMATVQGAVVGVGTVLDGAQLTAAREAGARFAVSPGLTPALAGAAKAGDLPLLPGVATSSELMAAREAGFRELKFFPAALAGGAPMLKAFAGVFRDVVFCPTGGITETTAPDYLALPNVRCVGGSWLTPADALKQGNWARIEALARAAAALRT